MQEQAWEYLEVYVTGRNWADSTGAEGEVSEIMVGGISHANTNGLLDDLGAVGWELIAVVPGQLSGALKLFFKRPLGEVEEEELEEA